MNAHVLARVSVAAFVVGFFVYLFAPLVVMGVTAFNTSSFPRVSPFECFSVEWFTALTNDGPLIRGLANSVYIGFGVVLLAVPIGMAGALLLTRIPDRAKPWYYTVCVSPILIPGVVLGISTLVFWDRLGRMFGASEGSVFYNGIFLTIFGQTTFVAAYCLLVFVARLQRFDSTQEEAAKDLGATPGQCFRKVLLPYLKPAILTSAVLAFLASFENYNTTVFTSLTQETLVTVLAGKVRFGINPSISALAVAIITLTLVAAAAYEIATRRQALRAAPRPIRPVAGFLLGNAGIALLLLIAVAGIGTIYFAGTLGVEECKAVALAEKRRRAQERARALEQRLPRNDAPELRPTQPIDPSSIFAPSSPQAPNNETDAPASQPDDAPNPFAPGALPAPTTEPAGASERRAAELPDPRAADAARERASQTD